MAHRLLPRGGADIDPLSPRDANAQRAPKMADIKTKTAAQLKAVKEKEHPPPPPTEVPEPPSTDRPDGATYQVGKLLGKGGFAVCYSGQLIPTKQRFALKIVKSHMPPKMEQKVCVMRGSLTHGSYLTRLVPNRAPNSFQDEAQECCPVPTSFLLRKVHLPDSRIVSQWFLDGYGEAKERPHRARGPFLLGPNRWCD